MSFIGKLGGTPRFIWGKAFIRSATQGTPVFMEPSAGISQSIAEVASFDATDLTFDDTHHTFDEDD